MPGALCWRASVVVLGRRRAAGTESRIGHPLPVWGSWGAMPAPFHESGYRLPPLKRADLHQQPREPRQVLACRAICRPVCRTSCRGIGRPRQVLGVAVFGWLAVAWHGPETA